MPLKIITLLVCLMLSPTWASAQPGPFWRLAQDTTAQEVSERLDKLEQALKENDLEAADSALGEVRRACFNLGLNHLDEATRQRVLNLRMQAATAGCNFGSGQYWGFDGLSFEAAQKPFVQAAEDKAYLVDRVITNSETDRASSELSSYRKVLDKPNSSPIRA
ncbi:hypothetical protein JST97_12250 [bacterium]|nr:hypothetical protein [bacterium]